MRKKKNDSSRQLSSLQFVDTNPSKTNHTTQIQLIIMTNTLKYHNKCHNDITNCIDNMWIHSHNGVNSKTVVCPKPLFHRYTNTTHPNNSSIIIHSGFVNTWTNPAFIFLTNVLVEHKQHRQQATNNRDK